MAGHQSADIFENFLTAAPWNRFDEWIAISIEVPGEGSQTTEVCAFFGEDQDDEFRLLILRGPSPTDRYLKYRSGDWIPEFGLDFSTTDGIRVGISDDEITGYSSFRPGCPAVELRLDEKQLMFHVLSAITSLVDLVDQDKVAILGESEAVGYFLWRVGQGWRADVREFPEEEMMKHPLLEVSTDRLKRLLAAKLPQEGVWEACHFFLPVTRFQGDQEVFVQCAGVAERGMGLVGLVTIEAHADPDFELQESLLGAIEKQRRIPSFLVVKEDRISDRFYPIANQLGIQLRNRKKLRELEGVRDDMIEEFPDSEEE